MNKQLKIWAAAGMMALFMGTAAAAPQVILPKASIIASAVDTGLPKIGDVYYKLDSSTKTATIAGVNVDTYKATSFTTPKTVKYNGVTYTVTKIDSWSFTNSTTLKTLKITSNITEIGTRAFKYCTSLNTITIEGKPTFGDGVFEECPVLTNITLNDSIEKLGRYMFEKCTALKSIKLPSKLKEISNMAFSNTALTAIDIPSSVQTIMNSAFEECKELKTVTLRSGLKSIEEKAFAKCTSLTAISLPSTLKTIGKQAFDATSALTGKLYIPLSVTNIGNWCFRNSNFTELYSECKATVGEGAFSYMGRLYKATLTGGEKLGKRNLFSCGSLSNLVVPYSSACVWDDFCFDHCPNLLYLNSTKVTYSYNTSKADVIFAGTGTDAFIRKHFKGADEIGFIDKYVDYYAKEVVKRFITTNMTALQKAKALHDWCAKKVNYDHDNTYGQENQSECSLFISDKTVCEGYAKAYAKLMNTAGIETAIESTISSHAWNQCKIGGVYLNVDACWDDGRDTDTPVYDWFMLSDKEVLEKESKSHREVVNPNKKSEYPMGDVNMDKVITDADITLLNQYINNKVGFNLMQTTLADLDFDGKITSADTTKLTAKLKMRFDLTGDGAVNMKDYALLHYNLMKQINFSSGLSYIHPKVYKADNNNDGAVTYKDAVEMKNYLKNHCGISTLYRMGDVNMDGKLTQADITKLNAYLTTSGSLNSNQGFLADMNNDGVLNATDLSKLKALLKYQIGDVNRDGKINSTDITLIKKHISKQAILSDAVLWYADVNCDGSIDISDYMKLGNDYNIPY